MKCQRTGSTTTEPPEPNPGGSSHANDSRSEVRRDHLSVVAAGQPAEGRFVDRIPDRFDAAVTEGELAHARMPAAELLGPDGIRSGSPGPGYVAGRSR